MKKTLIVLGVLAGLSGAGVAASAGMGWLEFRSVGLATNPCRTGHACVYPSSADGRIHVVDNSGSDTLAGVYPQSPITLLNNQYLQGNVTTNNGNVGACGSNGCAIIGSMTPTDSNGVSTWYDTVGRAAFYGTRYDWTHDIGWNLAENGSLLDGTNTAIGDQWESYYRQDATHTWMERHIIFIGTDGVQLRPITMQIERSTGDALPMGYTNLGLSADYLWISGRGQGQNQNFAFSNPAGNAPGYLFVNDSSQIRLATNNSPQLVQSNAAGTGTWQLAYVAGDDRVWLGDSGTGTVVSGTSVAIPASGGITFDTGGSESEMLSGVYSPITGGNGALGSPTREWGFVDSYLYQVPVPGTTASSSTIAPNKALAHISGTSSISTISTASLPSGFAGTVTFICDAACSFVTGGNINSSLTGVAGKAYDFVYDGTKWYVKAGG